MKIGIISSLELRTPPEKYGGTELIVSHVAEGLVARGHEVTLFASGDSITKAHLIPGSEKALMPAGYPINPNAAYLLMCDRVVRMSGSFDVIHNNLGWRFLPFVRHCACPVVNTYHSDYTHPRVKWMFEAYPELIYTSLSENHQKHVAITFSGMVYNGIDVDAIPFSDKTHSQSMVNIGRFDEQKGSHIALDVSIALNKHIQVIGRPETENQKQYAYFTEQIEPLIRKANSTMYGEVGPKEKSEILLNSRLFLFPVSWEEPFGLVITESMACGTPIVAYARGSIPEIVEDGVTGFIVNSSDADRRGDWIVKKTGIEGLHEAVTRIYDMPENAYQTMRSACRDRVKKYFTVDRMVEGYIEVYEKVVKGKYPLPNAV